MIQQFINREAELKFLEKKHLQDHAQLIIIYGRRRVGKTELIKQFIQEKHIPLMHKRQPPRKL